MTKTIPPQEMSFFDLSMVDDVGQIFCWQRRIFRAIKAESTNLVKELFDRRVIQLLISKGLFIESWISDHVVDRYPMVVEHKAIPVVSYPFEWSFSMFQDAALLILDLNQILREQGFQTRDAHGFNVVFEQGRPRFVDLGSIVRLSPESGGWLAEEEFVRYFYYPLNMWAAGDSDLARYAIETESRFMSHGAYLRYRYRLLRWVSAGTLHPLWRYYYKFRTLSSPETQHLVAARLPSWKGRILLDLQRRKLLPLQTTSLDRLHKRLRRLSPRKHRSKWGDYHSKFQDGKGGDIQSTFRFSRILALMKDLRIESMVECGGNQGVFSRLAAQVLNLKSIVCTDYDVVAIDVLYRTIRGTKTSITPAVIDCMFPTVTCSTRTPAERFRCDAVVALAITHHLVLTQKRPLDRVLQRLSDYSSRYIFIDFMPLGLWDGVASPSCPAWYTTEWFSETFQKTFNLIAQEELEENRILFVGEKRAPQSA